MIASFGFGRRKKDGHRSLTRPRDFQSEDSGCSLIALIHLYRVQFYCIDWEVLNMSRTSVYALIKEGSIKEGAANESTRFDRCDAQQQTVWHARLVASALKGCYCTRQLESSERMVPWGNTMCRREGHVPP